MIPLLEVILVMLALGLLLGFVGAGGLGFIISILTVVFGYPIHTALGTALAAMFFSSFSGSISHYREGNMKLRPGVVVGLTSAVGAWISSSWSSLIPEHQLGYLTSGMLFASGFALWFRMAYVSRRPKTTEHMDASSVKGWRFWVNAALVGFITGALSGLFGIGSTPLSNSG